jgi:hypothetical protein
MMDKILSVSRAGLLTLFFIFQAAVSFANTSPKIYESAVVLPWKFVGQSLNPTGGSATAQYQFAMNNLNFTAQGIPFVIPQAELNVNLHLKGVESEGNVTHWETDQLALQVQVGAFSLQKDIVQMVNGVQVVVHLKADCSPFTLVQANAHSALQWSWTVLEGKVAAHLDEMTLDWPQSSWQIQSLQCSGPAGFADLVQQELQQQLANADSLLPTIKSVLQGSLNEKMTNYLDQWKQPQWISKDAGVSLEVFGSAVAESKGLLFRALLRLGDPDASVDISQRIGLNLSDALVAQASEQTPTVIFSQAAIQDLVRQKSLWPTKTVSLNSISGFASLLRSRFLQFFLWPDLWHYSKSAPFSLTTQLNGAPTLQFSSTRPQVYVQAPLLSWVNSWRDGKAWNYIQLQTQLKSWMTYGVQAGKFMMVMQDPDLKTKAAFGADYVRKFHPSTYLSVSTMQKALEQSMNQQQNSFALPSFALTEDVKLQAKTLTQPQPGYFFMQWGR